MTNSLADYVFAGCSTASKGASISMVLLMAFTQLPFCLDQVKPFSSGQSMGLNKLAALKTPHFGNFNADSAFSRGDLCN